MSLKFTTKFIDTIDKIILPDGSNYLEVVADSSLDLQNIACYLKSLQLSKKPQETRIISQSQNFKLSKLNITDGFDKAGLKPDKLKVQRWQTNFFELGFTSLNSLMNHKKESSWDFYHSDFWFKLAKTKEDMQIVEDFMLGSFGSTLDKNGAYRLDQVKESRITANLAKAFKSHNNQIYLIYSKKTNLAIATFTLVKLKNGNYQLHSVAAKTHKLEKSKVKNKICLILASCLKVLSKNLQLNDFLNISNNNSSSLNFSCSREKVVQLYLNFGFPKKLNKIGFKIYTYD